MKKIHTPLLSKLANILSAEKLEWLILQFRLSWQFYGIIQITDLITDSLGLKGNLSHHCLVLVM